ncbi:MAG: hypothetical protein EPN43_04575 [Jatrophihabitans sp.]|nr:MAG: hypothetical protein EPN43_04575 [Jatrophihabitans sp.]
MSPIETALVFAGIPLVVIILVVLGVYGKALLHQPNRYRPGRPWNFAPAWYVPHPEALATVQRPQLSGSTTAVGGASGEW